MLTVVNVLLLALAGCSRQNEDYIPSRVIAEAALTTALEYWQAGKPAGEVPGTKPVVYATDSSRKEGQLLRSFRILGETSGGSGRTYAVVLELDNPPEVIKTQYIVVGIDPLWVFRQEDYELLMHWDHYMPDAVTPDSATSTLSNPEPAAPATPDTP